MSSTERNNPAPAANASTRTEAASASTNQASPQTDKKFVVRRLERKEPAQQPGGDVMTRLRAWRTEVRQRPIAVSVGALSIGLLTGYYVGGTLTNRSGGRRSSNASGSSTSYSASTQSSSASAAELIPAYTPEAAKKVLDAVNRGSGQEQSNSHDASQNSPARSTPSEDLPTTPGYPPSYGNDFKAKSTAKPRRAKQPRKESKLLAKFKQTSAYDRLQTEVSRISNQLIDQLSDIGHNAVLPAISGKANEVFGNQPAPQKQGQSAAGAQPSSLR